MNHKEKLQVLELDNCPLASPATPPRFQVTDASLGYMRHLRALSRVDLYDCANISKEAIQRFKVPLPSPLKVQHHRPAVEIHAYFAPATPPVPTPPRAAICKCCVIL